MTVLVISLLRLGDLILQRPLVQSLQRKHPGCKIHLLLNKQFSGIEFLFVGLIDKFIYFDRESLQKSSGEKEYSIFWGYQQLHGLVAEINSTDYEAVYNFTHNRLTAHIAGLVNSKAHYGIFSKDGQFFGLTNPWIRFFNSYFSKPEAAGFHYTELLAAALEIELSGAVGGTDNSIKARRGIVIQPLTSDAKKNWALDKYQRLAEMLEAETAQPVSILGAPFEQQSLSEVVSPRYLKICNLEEASLLIKNASLVVTGDTSIKHLAALAAVPILEISLGSSQPLQVGPYVNDAVILQSRVACGPCPHSEPCSQAVHVCGRELTVQAVFEAAMNLLNADNTAWVQFAHVHPELRVFKTSVRPVIGWSVECLSVGDKNKFDEVLQQKTMVVEELNRRQLANKGAPMKTELEKYLTAALKRLEKAEKEVLRTQGYTAQAEKLKILMELVKEQGNHENTSSSTR